MYFLKTSVLFIFLTTAPILATASTFESICRDWYAAPLVNKGGVKLYSFGYERDGDGVGEACTTSDKIFGSKEIISKLESACISTGRKVDELGSEGSASMTVIWCRKK